ncbi:hypothetical protein E6W36_08465 [Hankyongella ginsenosidimutans]|uniref:Glycosyltransferase family 4 protein n=1 Tax=Hankyongella ginsenosidimutans TaxID=1763828 RepID=A0A4D7BVM4_9SPHN|nr:hypothetical protein E6W36_08465 [Hankyongella ginsenosidimutans]
MFKAGQPCGAPCTECAAYHWRRGSRLAALNGLITASRHVMLTHEAAIPALAHLPARAVIPNGIEPPTAHVPLERPSAGALTVGYLGRLVRRKGAHAVVAAARLLGDAPVRFLIAGRGEAADEAALKAQAPGNVSFLGHVQRDDFSGSWTCWSCRPNGMSRSGWSSARRSLPVCRLSSAAAALYRR